MSPDVQKAAASLAAGRRDEARVYAWNALSSATDEELLELRRLAEKLALVNDPVTPGQVLGFVEVEGSV